MKKNLLTWQSISQPTWLVRRDCLQNLETIAAVCGVPVSAAAGAIWPYASNWCDRKGDLQVKAIASGQ